MFVMDFSESMKINSRKEYALLAILKVYIRLRICIFTI
jgi:hypothetical protein